LLWSKPSSECHFTLRNDAPHRINHYHLDRAPVHKCSNTNFKWTAPWRIVMASLQQLIKFSSINDIAQ
jgi:hypothetical protein